MPREPAQSTRIRKQQQQRQPQQSYPLLEKALRHQDGALSCARHTRKQTGKKMVQSLTKERFHRPHASPAASSSIDTRDAPNLVTAVHPPDLNRALYLIPDATYESNYSKQSAIPASHLAHPYIQEYATHAELWHKQLDRSAHPQWIPIDKLSDNHWNRVQIPLMGPADIDANTIISTDDMPLVEHLWREEVVTQQHPDLPQLEATLATFDEVHMDNSHLHHLYLEFTGED